jgi:hypothetical protein
MPTLGRTQNPDGTWLRPDYCSQGHEMTEENSYWRTYKKAADSARPTSRSKTYRSCIICRKKGQAYSRKYTKDRKDLELATVVRAEYTSCPKCPNGGIQITDEDGDPRCVCGWQPTARLEIDNDQ